MSELITASLIAAVPASIAAVAALLNGKHAKATRDEFREAIDDGNGGKNLGVAVHEIAKAVEVVDGKLHEQSRDMRAMREEYLSRFERLDRQRKKR